MTPGFKEGTKTVPSNLPCSRKRVGAVEWREIAKSVRSAGGRLFALWGTDDRDRDTCFRVFAVYLHSSGVAVVEHEMEGGTKPTYPSLREYFPSALRMERAIFDLLGIKSIEPDHRGWLRHGGWPEDAFPLRRDFDCNNQFAAASAPYPFVQVEGDGVHEIPVGPVHAGTIEPGHFRFSVVGEKVLRLEERFGYTHKGIERRFTELQLLEGHRLAARIAGDSTVAYSWAYCQALEGMAGCVIPPRAAALRAVLLEIERIANHLGDVGALANDAGFAFGLAQFSRIKEELLRATSQALGQRYLLDAVVPGGTQVDISAQGSKELAARVVAIKRETAELRGIYEDHAGMRDRFSGAGILTPQLASRLGVLGLAGRASGQPLDARIDFPVSPYDELVPVRVVRQEGDVAARVAVRFDEIADSCRIAQTLLSSLPPGPHRTSVENPPAGSFAAGLIEGWRGPVFVAIEAGAGGAIHRCHPHDPSWQNWPALEHAIVGNIVADFPLINKSFNLAYSGVDL